MFESRNFARIGTALCVAAAAIIIPTAALAQSNPCVALTGMGEFKDTTITSTVQVPADGARTLPAYCEVKGVIRPIPGSEIGVLYRLPERWNGKMLGIGGGGSAGNVRLDVVAVAGLRGGYATAQTDGGHPDPDGSHVDWAVLSKGKVNLVKVEDFGNRSIHLMTTVGKSIVNKYYDLPIVKAYFQGCSTGGREGLMEVQRYPEDYDGVVTGAPVFDLTVNTTAMVRTQFFHKNPASNLLPKQLPTLAKAVMEACDKLDGVEDGIITDPRRCTWQPDTIRCKASEAPSATCLSPIQVAAVRAMYTGLTARNGQVVAYPLLRGSESSWRERSIGTTDDPMGSNLSTGSHTVMYMVYADHDYPVLNWRSEQIAEVKNSPTAKVYEATSRDASAFIKRGGKWLIWHGFNDPGPAPLTTAAYYEEMLQTSAAKLSRSSAQLRDSARLFLAPGVYHCGGGPGPDQFDLLSALDAWVMNGSAPERIVATNRAGDLSRPLCPYPALGLYRGAGDIRDEKSFVCR